MFQFNFTKRIVQLFVFCTLVFSFIFYPAIDVHAKNIGFYSYKGIYNNLPEKYQSSEYLYLSNDIPIISFATYDGHDYRTSMKRTNATGMDYLYCVDNLKHVDYSAAYEDNNKLFNNELRARLCVAFYYGPSKWKAKAHSKFTTGNTITDYFMTQVVVHSLIYKYGDSKSSWGIDFNKISFKNNTGNLAKKTKEFYKFCCDASIYKDTSDIFKHEFSFKTVSNTNLYLENNYFSTPEISCNTNTNNSSVKQYSRTAAINGIDSNNLTVTEANKGYYNSSFNVSIPLSSVESLAPGKHTLNISEDVIFNRYLAGFFQSKDKDHTSQEVGDIFLTEKKANDKLSFSFLIGNVILHKKDSITGVNIPDAHFVLQQYNDTLGDYTDYKELTYNSVTQQYESGNIYISGTNINGLFKLVESSPGQNYINDWNGECFQLTDNSYSFEFNVENQPILGKLKILKSGDNVVLKDSQFVKEKEITLSNIHFGLYAQEDIFVKDNLLYPKDKKIVDLYTDNQGCISVNDLPKGTYYFKEEETNPMYELDSKIQSFNIIQNENRVYNEVSFQLQNHLKKCQLNVFKYYYDIEDSTKTQKKPLADVTFGLYAQSDIIDAAGNCIVAKDSLITKAASDKDGMIEFNDLLYADYYLKELDVPPNYVKDDNRIPIPKDDFKFNKEQEIYQCKKDILNQEQEFSIKISKYGDTFAKYQKEQNDNGEYYSYLLEQKPLKDVEFGLYNENNELIQTAITKEDGIVQYSKLKAGKYYVLEHSGPAEYLIHSEKIFFNCQQDSKDYNTANPPVFERKVENQLFNCTIQLYKSGEKAFIDKKGLQYNYIPLENVVFGIYQDFDYTFDSGEILPKDSCVGYIVTDKDGNGVLSTKLPAGNYYFKELETLSGYELNTNQYSFEIKPEGNQDIIIQLNTEYELINHLSKASVQIIKSDANTNKKLKNVEFTLYNDQDEKIGVYKTNHHGKILVEALPYGSYYFVETKCRNGYYSSNTKYRFNLESSDIITLNITNTPILKLGFSEHYKIGLLSCFLLLLCFVVFLLYFYKNHNTLSFQRKRATPSLDKDLDDEIS